MYPTYSERLETFTTWPLTFITPEELAKNGFYYQGYKDEVRCAFCKVEIINWLEGVDPAEIHLKWAPQCPFVQSRRWDEWGLYIDIPRPVHTDYITWEARLESFEHWPIALTQKPLDLANAGFFYTKIGDRVRCFNCDGGLCDWGQDEEPWEEHALWFSRCGYLRFVKGRDYIKRVTQQ